MELRYPTSFQTVDVAVFTPDNKQIILCKKKGSDLWQFPGGFADPKSMSLEVDAIREIKEETCVDIDYPVYIGSSLIDDERYRGTENSIKTALFCAHMVKGYPKAQDDIVEAKLFHIKRIDHTMVVNKHRILWEMLKNHLTSEKKPATISLTDREGLETASLKGMLSRICGRIDAQSGTTIKEHILDPQINIWWANHRSPNE